MSRSLHRIAIALIVASILAACTIRKSGTKSSTAAERSATTGQTADEPPGKASNSTPSAPAAPGR
jgi:hypothetical protein